MTEKLQKVLARAGYGSRRLMETWIEQGRVSVNKVTAKLGDRVGENDLIALDGRLIPKRLLDATQKTLLYHKNVGTVCSRSDPEGRSTIFEDMPKISGGRWISVGRLDISTSGLLIMTSDGELANRLMHPSYELEREYLVRVLGSVSPATINQLLAGVDLDDGPANFDSIVDMGGEGANHWYRVVVKEGRNREVRRLWESQGVVVSRLTRIRFGPVELPRSLARGQTVQMPDKLLADLYRVVGLKPPGELYEPEIRKSLGGQRVKAGVKQKRVKSQSVKTSSRSQSKPKKASDSKAQTGSKRSSGPKGPIARTRRKD
ncbi:MAG: pseudouridine synthase [Gammaproteobacteria bacterium]|nr:pseudouridine synthase [Gammaproteobacteria bacterium]MDH5801265.1 pseudouridine synthase [Gammaproteobacteria bacterium]